MSHLWLRFLSSSGRKYILEFLIVDILWKREEYEF